MTTTTPAEVAPGVPADRSACYTQGKAEWAAVKAWKKDGSKGTRPATPALDWMEANPVGSRARRAATARAPKVAVTFFKNGKPMPTSQNGLSSLAWQGTRGIDGEAPRIGVAALTAVLAGMGITDPSSTSWDATLANGVMMSARVEGDTKAVPQPTVTADLPAPVAVTTNGKARTGTPTAAKVTKAPAKKATAAKRTVTPRPKRAAAKAS